MRQGYVYAGVRKGLNGQKGCISKGCISKGCMSKEVSVRAAHLALQQGRQHNQPPPVVKGHAGRAVRSAPAAAVARYVIPRSAVRPHPRAQAGAVQLKEAHLVRVEVRVRVRVRAGVGVGVGAIGLWLGGRGWGRA